MRIDIIDIDRNIRFDFKKHIEEFLKFVPPEHLWKLNKIIVTSKSPDKKSKNASGLYYGYQNSNEINIILCVSGVFYKMPRIFFILLPIIPKLLLASTLFHEIGHHVQRISHGYKKERWERSAELYSKEMTKRVFLSSGLFKISNLFKFILAPILRFYKKQKSIAKEYKTLYTSI